jgi:hypothetical protein
MPYASYMQVKDAAGANIFEMKGWRWEDLLAREVKVHPTKSFPSSEPNAPLGLDFGSYTRHYALQGRLKSQREFNRLKLLVAVTYYENAANQKMVTLTVGTGGTAISADGIIEQIHAEWDAEWNYIICTIKFYETLYVIF